MARDKEHNMTYNDLGRWANMRFEFIKQHRPQLYQSLLKENKLHSYLVEFDRQMQDTLILTEEQMRQAEGITDELKRQDQLEWVCRMNNIRSRAEEIVMAELVYE
jgi:broad specificity phosphatase PhoE